MSLPRSYMKDFHRKLTKRDRRRILQKKALKKHQMVVKTISKRTGRKQV